MEQQGDHSKADTLDLTVLQSYESSYQDPNSITRPDQSIDGKEDHLRSQGRKRWNSGPVLISKEELKIRGELEKDIERDLEEEIKNGICNLALRLHRLYQHQKEKDEKESSTKGTKDQLGMKTTTLAEVNLTIRMEGGSKVEINEIKKDARERRSRPSTPMISENKQGKLSPGAKEFDWVRTLRSGTSSVTINKKHDTHAQILRNDPNVYPNHRFKKEMKTGNVRFENKKLLQLGWRN